MTKEEFNSKSNYRPAENMELEALKQCRACMYYEDRDKLCTHYERAADEPVIETWICKEFE